MGFINVSVAMAEKAQAAIVDLCEKLGITVTTKTEPQLRRTLGEVERLATRLGDGAAPTLVGLAAAATALKAAADNIGAAAAETKAVAAEVKSLVAEIRELVAILDPSNLTVTTPTGAVWRITKEGDST